MPGTLSYEDEVRGLAVGLGFSMSLTPTLSIQEDVLNGTVLSTKKEKATIFFSFSVMCILHNFQILTMTEYVIVTRMYLGHVPNTPKTTPGRRLVGEKPVDSASGWGSSPRHTGE